MVRKVSLAQTYRNIAAAGRDETFRVDLKKLAQPGRPTGIACNSLYYLLGNPLPDPTVATRLAGLRSLLGHLPIIFNDPAHLHTTLLPFDVGEDVDGLVATPYNPRFHKLVRNQVLPILPQTIRYHEVILAGNGGLIASGFPADVDPEGVELSAIDGLREHFGKEYPNIVHLTLGYLFDQITVEQHAALLEIIDSFNAALGPDGLGTVTFDTFQLVHETREMGQKFVVVEEVQSKSSYENPSMTDNGCQLMAETGYTKKRQFLQALCGMFGISEGNDGLRLRQAQKLLLRIDGDAQLSEAVKRHLPKLKAYTATGEHRYMPVAIAAANILRGRPVFDRSDVARLVEADPRFAYLTEVSPWLANAEQVAPEYLPPHNEGPALEVPSRKETYTWLDIGSAPKTGGAPTLNILHQAFSLLLPGASFQLFGADIAFPYYQVSDTGKITPSWYVDSTEEVKAETVDPDRPITYLNAKLEPNDVTSGLSRFPDGTLDFISACKVLHHLAKGPWQRIPFTSLRLVGPDGQEFSEEYLAVPITAQQQLAIDTLLRKLRVGGVAMLDLRTYPWTSQFSKDNLNNNLDDLMFMIQRIRDDEYAFYLDSPIIYRPNADAYSPQTECRFIDGRPDHSKSFSRHQGIVTSQPEKVDALFARANKLVLSYQRWKRGAWGGVTAAIRLIQNKRPFPEVYAAYLRHVPSHDPIKVRLLKEAAEVG